MNWIDIFGPPGVGKSTLLDRAWPPGWPRPDHIGLPSEWADFTHCAFGLLERCKGHPSYAACFGMTHRSFRKMATVHRLKDERIYVQTGLAQRGLGFGWRLNDAEAVRRYYELMPVSLGVVYLHCDVQTLIRRNIDRGKNRSYMIPHIDQPCWLAAEVISKRDIAFCTIDTSQPIEKSHEQLRTFVAEASSAGTASAA